MNTSRYPRILTWLTVALMILGFVVALTGSKGAFTVFATVYAAVLIAWIILARSTGDGR